MSILFTTCAQVRRILYNKGGRIGVLTAWRSVSYAPNSASIRLTAW